MANEGCWRRARRPRTIPPEFSDLIAQLERFLRVGLTVLAAYFVALWIASIWWTFRDIRARTSDVFLQLAATLLVAVFSFAGLLIYFILRPPKTLSELYEESLEEEAFLQGIHIQTACPVCKQRTETEFLFCPWCQTRLKRSCTRCERPLMLRWKMCPFCGQPARASGQIVETATTTAPVDLVAAEAARTEVDRGMGLPLG